MTTQSSALRARGFTLLELLIVLSIIAVTLGIFSLKSSTFGYWEQESALRRFSTTIELLHKQAIQDQEFYRLDVDFVNNSYTAGVLKTEGVDDSEYLQTYADSGALSLEIASVLNPSLGESQTLIPPPSYPSLAEPTILPSGLQFTDIRNMRGKYSASDSKEAQIVFSPRGFSEFAVIHLSVNQVGSVTILVNPFTGLTEAFREYKDFEWTYDKRAQN